MLLDNKTKAEDSEYYKVFDFIKNYTKQGELQKMEFKTRPNKNSSAKSYRNFAFSESYFSNYIEGTVFDIEEAKQIIKTNKPLPARKNDSPMCWAYTTLFPINRKCSNSRYSR